MGVLVETAVEVGGTTVLVGGGSVDPASTAVGEAKSSGRKGVGVGNDVGEAAFPKGSVIPLPGWNKELQAVRNARQTSREYRRIRFMRKSSFQPACNA